MAAIAFPALILSDADDPSDAMVFPTASSLVSGVRGRSDVRAYANGRSRLIRRAGQSRLTTVALPLLDRTQVLWLEAHADQLVLMRDQMGRKFYGVYSGAMFEERGYVDEADSSLTVTEVSYSEAV